MLEFLEILASCTDIYSIRQNLDKYFLHEEFILADKAYPTFKWCITPYMNRENLTRQQENFNTRRQDKQLKEHLLFHLVNLDD